MHVFLLLFAQTYDKIILSTFIDTQNAPVNSEENIKRTRSLAGRENKNNFLTIYILTTQIISGETCEGKDYVNQNGLCIRFRYSALNTHFNNYLIYEIQWNLDSTKYQGTGKIGSIKSRVRYIEVRFSYIVL